MSNGLIVYFSQGGTTARVAQAIASGLRAEGHEIDLCNIQDAQPPALSGYSFLGVGTPAHYFRPPFNVTDYVNSLPDLNGLPAFSFLLHGTLPGDTANVVRGTLARKGAREVGYFRAKGADYFLGYLQRGYLFSPDSPTADELTRAESFGSQVAGHMAGQEYTQPQEDLPPGYIYRLERFLANRWLVRHMYSKLFTVSSTCTACGLCIKECPTQNIVEDEKGHPVWGRDCLLCLQCELNCPQDAITSPVSWPLFLPFMLYNVSHASRNPSLQHVHVKHSRGRTQRV